MLSSSLYAKAYFSASVSSMPKKNSTRLVISFISHPLFTKSGSMKPDDDRLTKIGFVNVVETKI